MRGIFLPARSLATAEGLYKGWVRFRVSGLGNRIRVLTWDLFEASERSWLSWGAARDGSANWRVARVLRGSQGV